MAQELQAILNSGDLTAIFLNGTDTTKKVQVKEDITATNTTMLDTGLGITASTVQSALNQLAEVGLLVMSGSNLTPQTIGTTPTKVALFDTKNIETGVGIQGDELNGKAIATLNGVFKIRFEAFLSYASNVDITWNLYKNGLPFGSSITLSGNGASKFPILLLSSETLAVTDYIELYATASASTDITIAQSNGTLEKTIF